MIKGLNHQEDITVLNTSALNNKTSKHTKHRLIQIKKSTNIVEDVSIFYRTRSQEVSRDIGDFHFIIN